MVCSVKVVFFVNIIVKKGIGFFSLKYFTLSHKNGYMTFYYFSEDIPPPALPHVPVIPSVRIEPAQSTQDIVDGIPEHSKKRSTTFTSEVSSVKDKPKPRPKPEVCS